MKSFTQYLSEAEQHQYRPVEGDTVGFEINEELLIEAQVIGVSSDGVILELDDTAATIMESADLMTFHEAKPAKAGANFTPEDIKRLENISDLGSLKSAAFKLLSKPSERPMKPEKVAWFRQALDSKQTHDAVIKLMWDLYLAGSDMSVIGSRYSTKPNTYRQTFGEAEYKGRKVQLGKPMKGDVKKFKVFVKNPKTGNVKKVNFGDPNMEIKRDDPKRRKNFRARHGCGTSRASDRTKAAYWSCKLWSKTPVHKILSQNKE